MARREEKGTRGDARRGREETERLPAPGKGRRPSGIESLFQEIVRRTAALGLSSFVLTEEALRRAFSDTVPKDWVNFAAAQSTQMRQELMDRIAAEFGAWLRELDTGELQRKVLQTLLEEYDFELKVELSARPRSGVEGTSLSLVPRRK